MFFKTNKPEAVNAFNKFNADRAELRVHAEAFTNEYDATAVILGGSTDVYFGGIKFNNNLAVNREVWRKPDRKFGTSDLRVKPTKKEFQVEFDAEVAKWQQLKIKHFPTGTRIKKCDFYTTLGFDWGELFFSSFACFEHGGFLYIDTSISHVAKHSVEILGSEYAEAQAKKNKEPQS